MKTSCMPLSLGISIGPGSPRDEEVLDGYIECDLLTGVLKINICGAINSAPTRKSAPAGD